MRFRSSAGARRTAPLLATVLLFAALCATATYWALQLFAPPVAIAPSGSLVDWDKAPDLATASRLFGTVPSAEQAAQTAAVSSNIKVVGIAASTARGSAVLSIDGKPPRAYLAGDPIDEHVRLIEVRPDAVVIEQGGGRIELPTPERPDISILSAGPAPGPSGIAPGGAGRSSVAPARGAAASSTMGGARGAAAAASAPGAAGATPLPPYGAAAAPAEEQNPGAIPGSPAPGEANPSQGREVSAAASESPPPASIRSRTSPSAAGGPSGFGGAPGTPTPASPGLLRPGVRGALETSAERIA